MNNIPIVTGNFMTIPLATHKGRIYSQINQNEEVNRYLRDAKTEIKSLWRTDGYEEAEKRIQIITKRILNKFKNEST